MCFHYRVLDQGEAKETFRQWEETKRSQTLVFLGASMTPIGAAEAAAPVLAPWAVEHPRVMHWGSP